MRTLVGIALFVAVTAVHAQSESERRVEITLLDGTRVEGKLLEFGQRTYRVRIGNQVLEFSEKEVAEVRFNSTARRREEELARAEDALRLDPQNAAALTRRAELLAQLAREEEARQAYEAALKEMEARGPQGGQDVRAQQEHGRALLATKRFEEAIAVFQRALDAARASEARTAASAAVQAQLAEELARAQAELAAAPAKQAEEDRRAAALAAAGGTPVIEVSATSPSLFLVAPIAADGTVTVPWAGALPASGAADGSLRDSIAAAWSKRLPAGVPVNGLTVRAGSAEQGAGASFSGVVAPYTTIQMGVSGHPDWATNLIQLGSGDGKYEVVGLGEIEVPKGTTWSALLASLHRAVRTRDPRAGVWVRVLPHPWLSPVSMADLLEHIWKTLAQEAAVAESVTSIEAMQCTFSIDGEVRSLDVAARVEALLMQTGRLQAQIHDTHPVRTDKDGTITYRYRLSGSLLTDAGDVWGMEVARRRAESPEAPFRMGDYLDRLQAIAGSAGVRLGAVSGQPQGDGGVLRAEFTAGQPAAAVSALTGLERSMSNIHAYNVSLRLVGGKPQEWRLSAECHAGYRADPLEGVDPR